MMVSFVLSFFPRDVLDEILNLIESVSEDFPSYFYGSMGSENSRPIILRESIDKQKLAYILKHPSQFEFGTDFRNGQNQLGLLKTLLFHAKPKWRTAYAIQATKWIRTVLDCTNVWYPKHEP